MMRDYSCRVLASTVLFVSLAGCSASEDQSSESGEIEGPAHLEEYLKATWGITVEGFYEFQTLNINDDGSSDATAYGIITVEGLGSREIDMWQIQDSLADGGATTLFLTDVETGDERYFLYDQVQNYITIGDLTKGVAVSRNPDDTYEVWTFDGDDQDQLLTVDDGYEALKLVEQYNGFTGISPHVLLSAFVLALSPGDLEARLDGASEPNDGSQVASDPAVCALFEEFCVCAACLVLDRAGACEPCPDL